MEIAERIEQALERAVALGAMDPARRRGLRRRCATPCFPAAPASARGCASRSPRLRRRRLRRSADGRRGGDRTAALRLAGPRRPALLRRRRTRRGKASVHCRLRRAARGAGRRRADRAGLRDAGARSRRATPARWRRCIAHRRRGGRRARAASSPARPGNARRRPAAPTTSAPRPARCSPPRRVAGAAAAGADPEPWRALGRRLGEAYQVADDLRDVALRRRRARQADRPGRRARCARTPSPNSASTAPWRISKSSCEAAVGVDPATVPARASCATLIAAQTSAVLAQAARARRGLSRAAMPARPQRWPVGRGPPGASAGSAGATSLIANPRFQRWAAASPLTRPIARAARDGAVRSLRRLRLFAGPARLRAAAPVRDACAAGRSALAELAATARPARRTPPQRLLRRRRVAAAPASSAGRPLRPRRPGRGAARQSRRSPPWSSTTRCSTPTCAIRWRCCAARRRHELSRLLGLCRRGARRRLTPSVRRL